MRFDRRVRRFGRERPRVADALLAAALLPLLVFGRDPDQLADADRAPSTTVIMVLTCAALAARRRWPVPVLALTTVGAAAVIAIDGAVQVSVAALLALYTVAVNHDRRASVAAFAVTAAAMTTAALIHTRATGPNLGVLPFLAWTGLAAAVGNALRNRRAYVAAVEDRAVRAEHGREEEARRRVAEERLRIARELHDVVAHRIAVVNVQAGVASHLLRSRPDAAEEALGHVREAGRAVLDEVADILSVLRQPDDVRTPTAPAPSLAQLDELVASFAAAGLDVDWSLRGRPVGVSASVSLVAYRLLQEALTNAHKHGTGTAQVLVDYAPSALTLQVDNPIRRSDDAGAAVEPDRGRELGLVGMRERAAAVGGVVDASPSSNGMFHVEVQLPVQRAATA